MGYGDEIMATGIARGAAARGKRIAFGSVVKRQIRWHPYAAEIFRGNPNVAPPGSEGAPDLEWVAHFAGCRVYNRHLEEGRWMWIDHPYGNMPGEIFFTDEERFWAEGQGKDFVLIEPNVPKFKSVAANKQWPVERYDAVALELRSLGHEVVQFRVPAPHGPGHRLAGAREVSAPTFRHALALLARASLYVGTEGGLHHGAAAVGRPAVVIFGGFIPPSATGYSSHVNLFVAPACGKTTPCSHCRDVMQSISVNQVLRPALASLNSRKGPDGRKLHGVA